MTPRPLTPTAPPPDDVLGPCITDILTDDVLYNILEWLPLRDRVKMRRVSRRFRDLSTKFSDVDGLALSHEHIVTSNYRLTSSVAYKPGCPNHLPRCHRLLPRLFHVSKLAIHHNQALNVFLFNENAFKQVQQLVLPNTAFDFQLLHLWLSLERVLAAPKLTHLSILATKSTVLGKSRVFTVAHAEMVKSKRLKVLQLQGVLIGPKALSMLAAKYGDTLEELRLGGVCVHTPDSEAYWQSILKFRKLTVLELPPSLFSLRSHPVTREWSYFPQLISLQKLQIYICGKDCEMQSFVSHLPKSCTQIVVVNRSGHNLQKIYSYAGQNIHVKQLENKLVGLRWPGNMLDTHGHLRLSAFWEPPYFRQEDMHNFIITPEILLAQINNTDSVLPGLAQSEIYAPETMVMLTAKESLADFHSVKSPRSGFGQKMHTAREHSPVVEEPMEAVDILEFLSQLRLPGINFFGDNDPMPLPNQNQANNNFVMPPQELPQGAPPPVPNLPDISDPPTTPPPVVSTNGIQSPVNPTQPVTTEANVSTIQAVTGDGSTITSTWTFTDISIIPSMSLTSTVGSVGTMTVNIETETETGTDSDSISTDSTLSMDTTQRSSSPVRTPEQSHP
uniref:F-box domain-containing protein n=1 Tax=Panagrellus redivivus TaxID=6233 RepID=A0A7E4VD30_PANRE